MSGCFLLLRGFFQGRHEVLADAEPCGVVVGADRGGVHADQRQVRSAHPTVCGSASETGLTAFSTSVAPLVMLMGGIWAGAVAAKAGAAAPRAATEPATTAATFVSFIGTFSDQAFQQGGEHAGVPPDAEASVDGGPGTELGRHFPPLTTRAEPPDHPLELFPQPLRIRAVPTDRQIRLDELPLGMSELPARHDHSPTASHPAKRAKPRN
ncbi:hypothetical protein GCM10020254_83590 [Streptomyces goshikiensis]